ncbi:hypothetical protein BDC45DRAFT_142481 [Circinella umbellata]|nr:hypothetical protein BDC45DRAFT_142481 [Circinella umbellata]
MAFALVGYPVVAPNYFRHDPFDHPPHPMLAQILQIVASSQHHAQIATFMATMVNENEFEYFNHLFTNGKIDNDIMEAAEQQAANIIKNAIENTVTAKNNTTASSSSLLLDPYMSFGYLDNENEEIQQHRSEPKKDDNNNYEYDEDNDDDYADHLPHNNIITDPKQIEKYGYIPYLNYYYYHNDSDQQDNHADQDHYYIGDSEHFVSDAERAVQHQIDELETVCSSSSYHTLSSAAIIKEEAVEEGKEETSTINYKNSTQHDHNIENKHRKSIPTTSKSLFSGTESRERRGHYYYDLFSDMPDTRHAKLVTKRLNEVTRQRVRIW